MDIDWFGFTIASIAVVLAPGPGSLFVARTAGTSGPRSGFGAMAGDTCLILLSLLGVSALFRAYPSLFHLFRWAGAAYLTFMGLKLLLRKPQPEADSVPERGNPFLQGVSITLLNPKAVFFFMSFFPLFLKSSDHGQAAAYAAMAAAFQLISMTYLSLLVRASSWAASALRRNLMVRLLLEKLCGCVFVAFGVKVAFTDR